MKVHWPNVLVHEANKGSSSLIVRGGSYQNHHGEGDEAGGDGTVDKLEVVDQTTVALTTVHCLDKVTFALIA